MEDFYEFPTNKVFPRHWKIEENSYFSNLETKSQEAQSCASAAREPTVGSLFRKYSRR